MFCVLDEGIAGDISQSMDGRMDRELARRGPDWNGGKYQLPSDGHYLVGMRHHSSFVRAPAKARGRAEVESLDSGTSVESSLHRELLANCGDPSQPDGVVVAHFALLQLRGVDAYPFGTVFRRDTRQQDLAGAGAVAAAPTGELAGPITIPAGAATGMTVGAALGTAVGG